MHKISPLIGPLRATPPIIGSEEERARREYTVQMSKRALIDLCQQEASKFLVQGRYDLAVPGAIQVNTATSDVQTTREPERGSNRLSERNCSRFRMRLASKPRTCDNSDTRNSRLPRCHIRTRPFALLHFFSAMSSYSILKFGSLPSPTPSSRYEKVSGTSVPTSHPRYCQSLEVIRTQYCELLLPFIKALSFSKDVFGDGSIEMVPPYLLLSEANLGLGQLQSAEEFLTLANWSILKTPACSNAIRSQVHGNTQNNTWILCLKARVPSACQPHAHLSQYSNRGGISRGFRGTPPTCLHEQYHRATVESLPLIFKWTHAMPLFCQEKQ